MTPPGSPIFAGRRKRAEAGSGEPASSTVAAELEKLSDIQSEVIAFLSSPGTHGGASVERIDTHISMVFLAGQRALKLKRAVRFDYLDASTPERRRRLCEAEVRVNRRTAPSLYVGVVPIT